jgi:dihydropteroate synthase
MSGSGQTVWRVMGGKVLSGPFLVAGIVNVTPDSFFDGGRYDSVEAAVERALTLAAEGADILDVGGESTRPYAAPVALEEEMSRVIPVIRETTLRLREIGDDRTALSVDTRKAACAAAALDAGAVIVNDVSACSHDPELLDVLGQYQPGYVLMHSQGAPAIMQESPVYGDVVAEITAFFEENIAKLTAAGLPEENIVLDPGVGFGKLLEHNLAILRGIPVFASLGRPIYIGLSNKSFLEKLLGRKPGERAMATAAVTALAAARGAGIHRVHDAAAAVDALTLARGIFPEGISV